MENNSIIFRYVAHFGRSNPKPEILYSKNYGGFGIGRKEDIIQLIKGGVERAMIDYLKANFDL